MFLSQTKNGMSEATGDISQKLKRESLFDRTAMVTLSRGSLGYIRSESSYLLPSAVAANNRIKPGCVRCEIVSSFINLETQYLPIWDVAQ